MRAVVVFSGGMDSTVILRESIAEFGASQVVAVHFRYGQRHQIETQCAEKMAKAWGVKFRIVDVLALAQIGDSALVTPNEIDEPHRADPSLPASWLPGRNLVFLTLAAMTAFKLDAHEVWTGINQTDFSGYPDCRRTTLAALEVAINLGLGLGVSSERRELRLVAPLMDETKAEIFRRAARLGVLEEVVEGSHTCYAGDHTTRHDWGFGCGVCPACILRAEGWRRFVE